MTVVVRRWVWLVSCEEKKGGVIWMWLKCDSHWWVSHPQSLRHRAYDDQPYYGTKFAQPHIGKPYLNCNKKCLTEEWSQGISDKRPPHGQAPTHWLSACVLFWGWDGRRGLRTAGTSCHGGSARPLAVILDRGQRNKQVQSDKPRWTSIWQWPQTGTNKLETRILGHPNGIESIIPAQ